MPRDIFFNIVRGYLMGAADIVPGVSGGTIALVLGIYQRLVAAIKGGSTALGRFARLDLRGGMEALRGVEWAFLLPLGAGIGLAVFSLAHLLETLLADHPVEMAALFVGLVAGSIVIAWELLTRRDVTRAFLVLLTAVVVFLLLGLREGTSEDTVAQLADPALWVFFMSGAIAICAMILPGISGSFILVMLGMYTAVLGAVTDRSFSSLGVFVLGATIGLALFSQLLHWALAEHYDSVMAALIGLMLGSMRVLWPWPEGVDSTSLGRPDGAVIGAALLAVVAFVAVVGIHELAKMVERRTTRDEVDELQAS